MNLTDDERTALQQEFATQATTHRATLARLVARLAAPRGDDPSDVLASFRYEAHAVRGAAALVGLVEIAEAARQLEHAAADAARGDGNAGDAAGRARQLLAALDRFPGRSPGPVDEPAEPQPLVLHVEDNEANRRLLAAVLAHRPEVGLLEAASGEEGIALAATPGVALVLLDLRLPGISGEEVLERLRATPATRDLRVVVVSAEARVDERDRLFAAGADDYVVKPYDVEHLLAVVDEALVRRPL